MAGPKTPSLRQAAEDQATDNSSNQSVESSDEGMVGRSRWEDAFDPPLTASSAGVNIRPLKFGSFQVNWPVRSGPLLSDPPYDAGLSGTHLWGHQTNTQLQDQTYDPQQDILAVQYPEKLPMASYAASRPPLGHQTYRRSARVVLKFKAARLLSRYRAAIKKERALREQFDAAILDAEFAVRQIIDGISSLHADWQMSKNHREEMKMLCQQGCEEALRAIEQGKLERCPRHATPCDASTSSTGGLPNPVPATDFNTLCGNIASSELSHDIQADRNTEVSNTDSSKSASPSDQSPAFLQQMPERSSWIGVPGLVAPPYHSEFADLVITSANMVTNDQGCRQVQHKRNQVFAGDGTLSAARRGVVIEVPFATTLSQVSKIFRLPADVANLSLFDVPGSKEPLKNVVVEFTTQAAATSLIQDTTAQGYQLQDQHGNLHTVRAYLIPTLTAHAPPRELGWLWKGVTRRVVFAGFPQTGVWRFITRLNVPLHRILHLEYDCRSSELTVEFASILETGRAVFPADEADMDEFSFMSKMRYGSSIRFVCDEAAAGATAHGTGPIPYISPSDLVVRFNQLPWNQQAQPFLPYNPHRSEIRTMADKFQIEEEEVFPFLDRLEVEGDGVVYDVVGSDIKLTRRGVDYSHPAEDGAKLLMANTLHDPRCRDMWDKHFEALGVPNKRKYEEYGMIAKQRREEEAGTDEVKGYLKDAEIPEVIRQYCRRGYERKISYVGSEYITDGSQWKPGW